MFQLLFVLFVQFCAGQYTNNEYVETITQNQKQILNWTYPTNSNSYVGKNFNASVSVFDGKFDFIICGAGSSGSVIANRLSEIAKWKILVLEAGTWENNYTDIPDMAGALQTSKYNWGYFSTPQKRGFSAFIDQKIPLARGKAIGGSSVINFMVYTRGNANDYNKWGQINPGWSYDEILPYFKKSEKVDFPHADLKYHGTNGSLNVEYSRSFDELGRAYIKSSEELGNIYLDYNAANQMGVSIQQMNEINGRRDSAGKAFINPIKNRTNLQIFTNTLITKLLIKNEMVYGVQYIRNGVQHFATTNKEVILSAGAFNTPQILMLSGIGPKDHLKDMGISVEKDLPVGDNLWDHLVYKFQSFQVNYTYDDLSLQQQVDEYLQGRGPLAGIYNQQIIQFSSVFDGTTKVPDVEFIFSTGKKQNQSYEVSKKSQGYTKETYDSIIKPSLDVSRWSMFVLLLHPKSRGTVRLKSSSPLDFPNIDPNYFSDPRDELTLANALKTTLKYTKTKSFEKYNSTVIKLCHPSCNCSDWGTINFWRCMAIHLSSTVWHYGGTAKMGPRLDKTSVVDSDLRVHGIQKLRIADCSVIPVTISGHTNAAAYMIGEKASDLIKKKYVGM